MSNVSTQKSIEIASTIVASAVRLRETIKKLKAPPKRSFKLIRNRRPMAKKKKAMLLAKATLDSVLTAAQISAILSQPTPKSN